MAGTPKKRARLEREAKKRSEILARQQADERARNLRKRVRFGPKLAEEIIGWIASGIPIDDSVLNGAVISPGVATRVGVSPRAIWEWQKKHSEFAQSIARARDESSHRIADRQLALADVALSEPAMANACRVAADIMRWQAQVRKPSAYGDRLEVKTEVQQRPEWAIDFSHMTHAAKLEAFAGLGPVARIDRMRSLLFSMFDPAQEIAEVWGIPEAKEAVDRMLEWLSPRMRLVCDGKEPDPIPEAPAPARALAAPSPLDNVRKG